MKVFQWKSAWRHRLSRKKSCRSALIPLSCISRSHMSSQTSLTPQTPRPHSRPPSMGPANPTTPKQTHRTTATPRLSKRSMGTIQSLSLNHVRKGGWLVMMVTMVKWDPTQAMQHPIRPCPMARPTMHSQQLVSALWHAPSGTLLKHHPHYDHLDAYGSGHESIAICNVQLLMSVCTFCDQTSTAAARKGGEWNILNVLHVNNLGCTYVSVADGASFSEYSSGFMNPSSRPAQHEKVLTAGMFVAAMNFMTNSTVANNGRSGSIQLLEQGSNASARPSQQQPFQTDVPDSAYTNGHIPPHATNGTSGDSEGRTVPSHAERQGSPGSGQRGDGREPERQGSHGRYSYALLCLRLNHKLHNQNACMFLQ